MAEASSFKQVQWVVRAALLAAAIAATPLAHASDTAAPKMQLPADQKAYKAAQLLPDPAARLAAFQAFLKDYPKSKRLYGARYQIFHILLEHFPERTKEIDKAAHQQVKQAGKGLGKLQQQANVASELAEAGPNGVDLPQAEKWARNSLDKSNEADYDKATLKNYKKYKQTPPKPAQMHKDYSEMRAGMQTALAQVYLHQGKQAQAAELLNQAYQVTPLDVDVNTARGELALQSHEDAEALKDFERAELAGDLDRKWRTKLVELYKTAHAGSEAGLQADLDAEYARLFPPPFTPAKAAPVQGGHTALLELFTGSGCPPCVGGDLAVDGLLHAYPRSELVALAFDRHIPEPDPLANPDTDARAKMYKSQSTPNYFLDGVLLPVYGNSREKSKDLYDKLDKDVATEAGRPTAVQLKLMADRTGSGEIQATAMVTTGDEAKLAQQIVPPKPEKKKEESKPADKKDKKKDKKQTKEPKDKAPAAQPTVAAKPAPPAKPKLIVNFALVEDDVRYSGENGVRFHRYVVRSLAKPADGGFPVEAAGTAKLEAGFNPAEISSKLHAYLLDYQTKNDHFGPIKFLSTDTAMNPAHLFVAAWVQDAGTHRVLDAAIVPVGAPADNAATGALARNGAN